MSSIDIDDTDLPEHLFAKALKAPPNLTKQLNEMIDSIPDFYITEKVAEDIRKSRVDHPITFNVLKKPTKRKCVPVFIGERK
jgi:hypothetical protein